ncbi:MAG: hypothetical protein AB7O67_00600 [Vicinamibacterales bacterium]
MREITKTPIGVQRIDAHTGRNNTVCWRGPAAAAVGAVTKGPAMRLPAPDDVVIRQSDAGGVPIWHVEGYRSRQRLSPEPFARQCLAEQFARDWARMRGRAVWVAGGAASAARLLDGERRHARAVTFTPVR